MNNHGMSSRTKVALWLVMAGALSCNLNTGGEISQRGPGRTHPRSSSGDVVEQWVGSTPMDQQMAATEAAMARVQPMASAVQTAKMQFVNCDGPCVTRLQTGSLADARALLSSVSAAYQGRISFTAREVLDPYTGRSFQLDVLLDTDKPRPVPETDDELVAEP
jgi:hypothetical protein